jgi:hypothetical protein
VVFLFKPDITSPGRRIGFVLEVQTSENWSVSKILEGSKRRAEEGPSSF